ncbi:MAG TPA: serine/threonine protein phosphatase, partial [Treponema sp.]|nr:serine/threonine protein phosphatase [Treponema sp.]
VSDLSKSRGFFLVNEGQHLYIFCRYTKLFDSTIYDKLYSEFCRFENRTKTISDLAEISSLSQEWQQLAETQRSFLPAVMPEIEHLELAAYFRPLVNVSGDYYSVLPISRTKTLLMLGDVSGKGLAAALVMDLVMNTVKILENKSDLPAMIKAVDKAIKSMRLQDKYTVLFLGIVDTSAMTISYVNASMSDPIVITRTPSGYKIKPLTSNCSVVGIIDIPDVQVATQKLYRGDVILMASDGVSEVMDDSGTELGDTELYKNTLCSSAKKHPKEFVDDIVDLVLSYNGGKKLRDDVTMMVAKVVD